MPNIVSTFKELQKLNGKRVLCKIGGVEVVDAKVFIEPNGLAYLCQNVHSGNTCSDLLGYKYSWHIGAEGNNFSGFNITPYKSTQFTNKRWKEVKQLLPTYALKQRFNRELLQIVKKFEYFIKEGVEND